MTREEYINSSYDKYLYSWSNISIGMGVLVFPCLSLLDYFASPSNFKSFFYYRIITAFCILVLYLFNKSKIKRQFQNILIILTATIVSSTLALMISKFGGHQSPYFAGMILLVIYVFGLVPINLKFSLIIAAIIYMLYLLPIVAYDNIINKSFFISANVLMLFSIFTLILFRYISLKRLLKEFSLQYDVDQQKDNLEDIVQERTKELSISEKRLKSLFEYATDGIMIMDGNGNILDVNQKACEIYGFDRDEIVNTGINLLAADKPLLKERLDRLMKGESLLYETQHLKKDGKKVTLEITANAIEAEGKVLIQAFVRDITDKKRLQEQLLQSQKMESIGSLAGGIAHNFNNLLASILGNAELLEEYGYLDKKLAKRRKNIETSAKKAGVLVSKLLSFARKDSTSISPLQVNNIIKETSLFEGVLGKKIKLGLELAEDLPTVEGDRNQLEQVIINLIVNARDAMPDGGLITIKSSLIHVGKDALDISEYSKPGDYILLSVSDTGCGIKNGIINRIFEPFFTTKERGKGTGLGLATVYGIVKDHNGYITVQSEAEKGTTFYIHLPVSGKPVPEIPEPQPVNLYGNGNILIVDDEDDVLDYVKDALEIYGYQAIAINNPLEAVELFPEISEEVDLVITDIIMPQMSGKELILHIRSLKPDIKIIAISGYSDDPVTQDNTLINAFVKKPFEGSHLLATVKHVLNGETVTDYQNTTRIAT